MPLDRARLATLIDVALGCPETISARQHAARRLADRHADLTPRIVVRAAAGQPISAPHYLVLCAALRLHPATFARCDWPSGPFLWGFWRAGLKGKRLIAGLSQGALADKSGLSRMTVIRAERGCPVSADSFVALNEALDIDARGYVGTGDCFTSNNDCYTGPASYRGALTAGAA